MTEYQDLLRDTIDFQGGDNRELIDLSFKFIEGTPPRTVNKLQLMEFGGSYEDFVMNPQNHTQTIYPDASSDAFGIRTSFTGHSFNNPPNCSEFCRRNHFFTVDDVGAYSWYLWKECSDNPLYPQGGTWIYDRTGWCPGAPVDEEEFDITNLISPGVPAALRKGVEADPTGTHTETGTGMCTSSPYGNPNFNTDAEVYDILAPNDHDEYLRFNPICANPVIVIRNSGGNAMTEAKIEYGMEGVSTRVFTWSGNLEFMQLDTVVLPTYTDYLWNGVTGKGQFVARILEVNGNADEHSANDAFTTHFEPVPSYDSTFVIFMRTNNAPEESSWDIRNIFGDVLYSAANFAANTTYTDTVHLSAGCYLFNMYDTGDDGLDFWNNNDGSGSIRFLRANGFPLNTFDPDFGDNIRHQFSVGELNNVGVEEVAERAMVNIYPNPFAGNFQLVHQGFKGNSIELRIYDSSGRLVVNERWANQQGQALQIKQVDLTAYPAGIYQVIISDGVAMETRVISKAR